MQMVKFPARAAADWLLMKPLTKSDAADTGEPHARHDGGDQLNSSSFLSTGSQEQRSAWTMGPPCSLPLLSRDAGEIYLQ